MYITEKTLDDLLYRVVSKLLQRGATIGASRGKTSELTGVLLHLTDPRARLSRTEKKGHIFSCLGELLWYLSKSNSVQFISHYVPKYEKESDDGHTVYGGYGPRLFAMRGEYDQIQNVITLLRNRPSSRRAVIQLFDAEDIAQDHIEIPCTCTLQFLIRERRLNMITYMRSNDAFFGLPHDVFAFTMLQEIVARSLGVELGTYKHCVGSLHLYDEHRISAQQYIEEGYQARVRMPPMPTGDPFRSIGMLLQAESTIRNGHAVTAELLPIDLYWQDVVRLLQVYQYFLNGQTKEISKLRQEMVSPIFSTYIEQKKKTAKKRVPKPPAGQLPLF